MPIKITIQIETISDSIIACYIFNELENNRLNFYTSDGILILKHENTLAITIRKNQFQFEKVIRSALKGNIKVGQIINCVFIEDFNFLNESDFNKFIRVDRRNDKLDITTSDSATTDIHKIYADGSFACETLKAGYGGFTEDPNGKQEIFFKSFDDGSSNLMELLAVTEGLQRLQAIKKLQVNTDSRFVIRGLVQWCHFWRHNNWQTAFGEDVKYAESWKNAYRLCEDKFVEFKWIKGHSGNMKQDFCHQLAKESTKR
ncbi:MAG: hypothetical protein JEZ09_09485 [Salinivirgaceae bacterium]|nr:hypothetical protein [Salinivirgaceae bacterium]